MSMMGKEIDNNIYMVKSHEREVKDNLRVFKQGTLPLCSLGN